MNPMLAEDWDPEKLKFPVILQPKIDGVRGWAPNGQLLARSMNPHENKYTTAFYNNPVLKGLDGELVAEDQCHPRLCSLTSSALSTIEGEPYLLWWLFDIVNYETEAMPYAERLLFLDKHVKAIKAALPALGAHLRVMPHWLCSSMEEVLERHNALVALGYEGSCLRSLEGKHKQGRSSPTQGGLLRIKSFSDAEGVVIELLEGQKNNNEATINAAGYTERSTSMAGMVPSGMCGGALVKLLKDVKVNNGKKIIPAGTIQRVGAGKMSHAERMHAWANRESQIGLIWKFQHFPKGVKDALRFPTFQSVRSPNDL